MLTPYIDFVQRRWAEGCRNAAQLWREVGRARLQRPPEHRPALGRRASLSEPETATSPGSAAAGSDWPKARTCADGQGRDVSEPDGLFVVRLLTEEPALGIAIKWAKQLNAMLRHRVSENLDELLHAADGTLLANFAA